MFARRPSWKTLFYVVGAVLFALAPRTHAEPDNALVKVRARGEATGSGLPARRAAVRHAEQQALAVFIESIVEAPPREAVSALLKNTQRYVQSSRVLDITQENRETKVEVEAYIKSSAVQSDLAFAMAAHLTRPPRAIFLISQHMEGQPRLLLRQVGSAEQILTKIFTDARFEVIDGISLRASYTEQELASRLSGRPQGAAGRFGRENRADVVVLGTVEVRIDPSETLGNTKRMFATVTLKVVRANDGKLIDSHTTQAIVSGRDPLAAGGQATRDALSKITQPLLVSALLAAVGGMGEERTVLTVEGVTPGRQSREVMDRLKQMTGMSMVEELRPVQNRIRFQMKYDGGLKALVEHLTAHTFSSFTLEPQQIVGSDLKFRAVNR